MLSGFVLSGFAVIATGSTMGLVAALIAWGTVGFAIRSLTSASGRVFADGFAVVFILISAMYIIVRLAFWQTAIFAEDDTAWRAIDRSWRLVEGHWWRTAAILAVAAAVASAPGAIVSLLLGLGFGAFNYQATGSLAGPFTLHFIQVVSQATRVVTLPLVTANALAIYHDLKLRREGVDRKPPAVTE